MRRIAVAAVALLTLAALAAVLHTEGASALAADDRTVTVQGSGSATATPDRAQLSFGVETRGETARAAIAANATAMRAVIAVLRKAGATDLRTQSVWLSPTSDGGGKPNGFVAQNSVSAETTVARAGAAIDAAVDAGANQVSGPSLSASDADALYRQALREAVEDARERAQTLAGAAGTSLGRITQIVEGGAAAPPVVLEAQKATADATPIEPGSQEIAASVTVTFVLS